MVSNLSLCYPPEQVRVAVPGIPDMDILTHPHRTTHACCSAHTINASSRAIVSRQVHLGFGHTPSVMAVQWSTMENEDANLTGSTCQWGRQSTALDQSVPLLLSANRVSYPLTSTAPVYPSPHPSGHHSLKRELDSPILSLQATGEVHAFTADSG